MATIKEIANKAGVSMSTVSRVLNFDLSLSISKEKRKKILEIAEQLNYQTPKVRKNRNKVKIGLINWYLPSQEIEDPYYLSIRLGIEKKCEEQNVDIIKLHIGEVLHGSISNIVGVIALGKFSQEEIDLMERITNNIVFVDSSPLEKKYDSVVIDFKQAVEEVLNYLVDDCSYKSIGYIGGRDYTSTKGKVLGERREQVFRDFLTKKDMYDEKNVYIGKFTPRSGYELMRQAINDNHLASVYFFASDSMAIGAFRALHESGIKIPNDVGVIGFNDITTAQFTFPPLSTVKIYTELMGETAVDLLLERVKNGRKIPKKILVSTKLIKRASTIC